MSCNFSLTLFKHWSVISSEPDVLVDTAGSGCGSVQCRFIGWFVAVMEIGFEWRWSSTENVTDGIVIIWVLYIGGPPAAITYNKMMYCVVWVDQLPYTAKLSSGKTFTSRMQHDHSRENFCGYMLVDYCSRALLRVFLSSGSKDCNGRQWVRNWKCCSSPRLRFHFSLALIQHRYYLLIGCFNCSTINNITQRIR